ncbi:MAG: O-antigen ligase family protein [Syntrophorhabdaceae bacterium]
MTIASIYVLLCAVGLPFWMLQQHLGGRSIPFVLASCGYVAYAVIFDAGLPLDNITLIAGCIAAWLCVSITWTDTRKSIFELFNLVSYLILFTAARQVPIILIALSFFAIGLIFAASQIYRICFQGKTGWRMRFAYLAFGNENHTGNFMLINLFVGLWLAVNLSPWLLILLPLILAALITAKCKAAYLGAFCGLCAVACHMGSWPAIIALAVVAVMAFIIIFAKYPHFIHASYETRIDLWRAGIELIKRRPFTGFGLNSYARELPETKTIIASKAHQSGKRSHRAHNDHIEIVAEVGILGYLLFAYLFSSLTYNPIFFGLMIGFVIHSLFFFPFREVHTAAPFWALMGTMAAGGTAPVFSPVIVKIVALAILSAVAWKTLRIFLGQWYSEIAKHTPDMSTARKIRYVDEALKHDPDDTGYLTDAAVHYFKVDPIKALRLSMQAAVNYDGVRMKHMVYDLFARCLINAKESKVCHWLEDEALRMEKDYDPSITIKNYLYTRDR